MRGPARGILLLISTGNQGIDVICTNRTDVSHQAEGQDRDTTRLLPFLPCLYKTSEREREKRDISGSGIAEFGGSVIHRNAEKYRTNEEY